MVSAGPLLTLSPVEVDLYAGAQKVVESDKSLSADARVRFGDLGVGGRYTQFREPAVEPAMSTLTLGVWSLSASYRIRSGGFEIEPELGVAGLRYGGDGQMPLYETGIEMGVSGRLRIANQTNLLASGRGYSLGDTGSALEGRAGIAVGPLQVSYRYLKFEVGPALMGPEVGLGARF